MLELVFLPGPYGRVLGTFFTPPSQERAATGVVLIPPFAEEMNRSRATLAALGYALARAGTPAVAVDPYGTGDSAGDFADADWEGWQGDVFTAASALAGRGARRLALCGLRTGALLALATSHVLPLPVVQLILWHPVASGRSFLTQFLRLRVAAAAASARSDAETTEALRARLWGGEALEIAGYTLSPGLAASLEELDARAMPPPPGVATAWLEVAAVDPPRLSQAGVRVVTAWRGAGCEVAGEAVTGSQFWATQELTTAPRLVERSMEQFRMGGVVGRTTRA